ncbi:class I glutamine amidotransferase family protein [Schizosaccharomyces pombe]|uniref:Putative glutamine amidotransferase PB2B2.05 n=1 Tax=Schizosaccharomyces pombe (strain 972 / ATCC 24843) TaxID=284812 RepID=YHE5_SCHPO|nr:peptidase family C26 protein [Schizosaccharomyces pombe]Q9HDV0.2 RecName: Full=Putative glutamine amidotransferase PB2B2.05 [Schizosaccharomyces pombe 972h-]CAC21407.2 peptidase family C26 protein [Schizosaccharomyces pombe]|eukprot:NP_596851.2 peptidase family C26 protein [Schizosaccharomyces pombe]
MECPIIALSVGFSNNSQPYVEAIIKAGGCPIVIYPGLQRNSIPPNIDGIILAGGESVHPNRYGEDFDPNAPKSVDVIRDSTEWGMIDFALKKKIPILGICRGCQVLNVYFGGSLYQNVSSCGFRDIHRPSKPRHYLAHKVMAKPGKLKNILGSNVIDVNSIHDQGIKTLGMGLQSTVISDDGLCEGIESKDGLIIGVQWHPEAIIDKQPHSLKLFQYFINRSKWHMKQSNIFSNVPHESSFYRNSIISIPIAP